MKSFSGEPIGKYYETGRSGKLTDANGSYVRTDNITLQKGTYVLSASYFSDSSLGVRPFACVVGDSE